jgi:DNA polymerase III subunit alpha
MEKEFFHLHLHSQYSIIDGFSTVEEIIHTAKTYKMSAIALTDHGTLSGCIDFYKTALKNDIKPILGCEVYMASGSRFEKKLTEFEDKSFHLTILAKNTAGFQNLTKLVSLGYLEGFYYKPRIDMELLEKFRDNLIILSGCINSEFAKYILVDNIQKAKEIADRFKSLFSENFFIELQFHNLEEDKKYIPTAIKIANDLGIKIVATNDAHYTTAEDYLSYDTLLCIKNGKKLQDTDRLKLEPNEFYIKSPDEMKEIFKDYPQALDTSFEIAQMIDLKFDFSEKRIPKYEIEENIDSHTFLRKLCTEGLKKRVSNPPQSYWERLHKELETVEKLGFSDYFLIVHDIVKFAKSKGIYVGPGRGSAASSLISYVLEITNIDPLKYNLLFERFLNIGRNEPPDIDIDIQHDRRQEVIEYLRTKYGENNIAHILTFGTLSAKAAIRDVGRVIGINYAEVDKISKMIPEAIDITIQQALETTHELKTLYNQNNDVKNLIDLASRLEGKIKNTSTHAAGVVISNQSLISLIPLMKSDDTVITGIDANALQDLGMLKIDILGLKTLTFINKTLEFIKNQKNLELTVEQIPFNDSKTYQMLSEGKTTAVFQLESAGMKDLLRKIKPQRIEDIIDILALYRPGPLQSGMVDKYISNKKHPENIQYFHDAVKDFLQETYGILLYQEQVMAIAHKVGMLTLEEADKLRKAMGKKDSELLKSFRNKFIQGAKENGLSENDATRIFEAMEYFSGYGFNKSHSAGYAYISYLTAYLKANFPLEFFCASLIYESDNLEKISEYIQDAKSFGIEITRPSVNKSEVDFSISDGKIIFGFSAIKNIGTKAAEEIVKERKRGGPFKTFFDLLIRTSSKHVTKEVYEALIKSGCTDEFNPNRAALLKAFEKNYHLLTTQSTITTSSQKILFATASKTNSPQNLFDNIPTNDEEFSQTTLLNFEKEYLGMYITYDPLNNFKYELDNFCETSQSFKKLDNQEFLIGGMIENIKNTLIKSGKQKGQRMIRLRMRDLAGYYDAYLFPANIENNLPYIIKNKIVVIRGVKSANREEPYVKVIELFPIENIWERLISYLKISISDISKLDDEILNKCRELFLQHPGPVKITFFTCIDGKKVKIEVDDYKVKPSYQFLEALEKYLGDKCYELIKKPTQTAF